MSSYSDIVLEHFGNPRNVGPFEGVNAVGLSGNPDAGPFARIYLRIDGSRIVRASFETYGCAASIAAGSVLTEWLRDKSLDEARALTGEGLLQLLGGLPLGKKTCAHQAVSAVLVAIASRP